jgi:hypothetical protein
MYIFLCGVGLGLNLYMSAAGLKIQRIGFPLFIQIKQVKIGKMVSKLTLTTQLKIN